MAKLSDADIQAQDPRTVSPREHIPGCEGVPASVGPLCAAIPKQNLLWQAQDVTLDLMAEIINDRGASQAVSAPTISKWIRGERRMTHRSVINVSHALGISPLAVLDLCQTYQHSAPDAMETRSQMQAAVRFLATHMPGEPAPRWIAEPGFVGLKPGAGGSYEMDEGPQAYDRLKAAVLAVPGDYRDLTHLTRVAAEYYAEAPYHQAEDVMLEGIMQLGRAYTSIAHDMPGFLRTVERMAESRAAEIVADRRLAETWAKATKHV